MLLRFLHFFHPIPLVKLKNPRLGIDGRLRSLSVLPEYTM